jgi:transcriptional regulator with XRE-family HTH domain
MEERIRALRSEGLSIREVARELGINRGKVHRVLMAEPSPAAAPAASAQPADAVLGPLSERDLEWLGLSVDEATGGLNELNRYRLRGRRAGWASEAER